MPGEHVGVGRAVGCGEDDAGDHGSEDEAGSAAAGPAAGDADDQAAEAVLLARGLQRRQRDRDEHDADDVCEGPGRLLAGHEVGDVDGGDPQRADEEQGAADERGPEAGGDRARGRAGDAVELALHEHAPGHEQGQGSHGRRVVEPGAVGSADDRRLLPHRASRAAPASPMAVGRATSPASTWAMAGTPRPMRRRSPERARWCSTPGGAAGALERGAGAVGRDGGCVVVMGCSPGGHGSSCVPPPSQWAEREIRSRRRPASCDSAAVGRARRCRGLRRGRGRR